MELRHRRRAFVNGALVSAIRLQSLTQQPFGHLRGVLFYMDFSLRSGELSSDKDFYHSLYPLRGFRNSYDLEPFAASPHIGAISISAPRLPGFTFSDCRFSRE